MVRCCASDPVAGGLDAEVVAVRWRAKAMEDFKYPMYVMKVTEALKLESLEPHNALLAAGKLELFEPTMNVVFVSHQWLSFKHPDPGMRQFKVLQQTLRLFFEGKAVKLCPAQSNKFSRGQDAPFFTPQHGRRLVEDGYIWYDWFGVPQLMDRKMSKDVQFGGGSGSGNGDAKEDEQQKLQLEKLLGAVESIPAYVQACDHFIVLAPHFAHADTGKAANAQSWNRRGWCRTEMAARGLSPRPKCNNILTVWQSRHVVESYPFQWIAAPPKDGDFAVEDDRAKVDRIFGQMLDARLVYLRSLCGASGTEGKAAASGEQASLNLWELRLTQALRAHMAAGGVPPADESLERWLARFDFRTPAGPPDAFGFAPAHLAAIEGNSAMLEKLASTLGAPAVVKAATTGMGMNANSMPGSTPLILCFIYIGDEEVLTTTVRTLYRLKADPEAKATGGVSALHFAALGPCRSPKGLELVAEALPHVPGKPPNLDPGNLMNMTPLYLASKA